MSLSNTIERTALRAVIEAQIAVTTAKRHDLLPEIRTLRRRYENAPGQPEVLAEVRDTALVILEHLRTQPKPSAKGQ